MPLNAKALMNCIFKGSWQPYCVCVCFSLIEQWNRCASLALLHHVGLVTERDTERGWG